MQQSYHSREKIKRPCTDSNNEAQMFTKKKIIEHKLRKKKKTLTPNRTKLPKTKDKKSYSTKPKLLFNLKGNFHSKKTVDHAKFFQYRQTHTTKSK